MAKIQMKTPLVEMDGDEMTRIIWKLIKEKLILPFVDLKTEYYDLGLPHRNETNDQVTVDSAIATKKYGVAVKCATITPNAERMTEYDLKESKAELAVTAPDGTETRRTIFDFQNSDGIIQGLHNVDASIESFARTCLSYGLDTHQDVWFATKDTISKTYDHRFKDIFAKIYEEEFKEKFEKAGIEYFYTLIDDAVARVIRSEGGYIWACKNYDGDVMSDMVATAYGSLAMMTSVLVSPDGVYEYEAAHGTVQRHYYKYLKGEPTSTNSVATIFAWSGALRKRGELDHLPELVRFANTLEKATIDTIEDGIMTGDLYLTSQLENKVKVGTEDFLTVIGNKLSSLL